MTSLVAKGAGKALLTSVDAMETKLSGQNKGNLKGRTAAHWSYYLFISGSALGGALAIAATIATLVVTHVVTLIGVIVAGTFMCLTNGLAAYYIKHFSVLKHLDSYVGTLNKRAHNLSEYVVDLEDVNKNLAEVGKDMAEVPENFRKKIKEGNSQIKERVDKLEIVKNELKEAEQRLDGFAKITDAIRLASKEVMTVSQENGFIGGTVAKLFSKVSNVNEKLNATVNHFVRENEEVVAFSAIVEDFTKNVKVYGEGSKTMKKNNKQLQKKIETLNKEVNRLTAIVPLAADTTHGIEKLSEDYRELNEKLQKTIKKLNQKKRL